MKVGIVGFGVVGQATADVLRRLGHVVVVQDTDPGRMTAAFEAGYGVRHEAVGIDADFLCVPETQLSEALAVLPRGPLVVIRSTVPPGTTDSFAQQFDRPMAYMPEFLRQATAHWDALNPAFILIGSHDDAQGRLLAQLFAPLLAQVIQVTPSVAEMVKITLNAYLHMLISFWNEIHLISEIAGVPSHLVGRLCAQDARVAAYGAVMHGNPVGGVCLPKDLEQLIRFAETGGYEPGLLREVQRLNEKVEENEGWRALRNRHLASDQYAELMPSNGVVHLNW